MNTLSGWQVSREEAQETVDLWYSDRKEVLSWQEKRKKEARLDKRVFTLLGRARHFPSLTNASKAHRNHIERAAINTPVQVGMKESNSFESTRYLYVNITIRIRNIWIWIRILINLLFEKVFKYKYKHYCVWFGIREYSISIFIYNLKNN